MDKSIMFGPADLGWAPTLADVGEQMSAVLGFPVGPVTGGESLHGYSDSTHAWLTFGQADNEPFRSHPYDLAVSTGGDVEPILHALYDRLAEQGRWRLMLIFHDECVRSTHFPCDEW
jgi:hypothetical protein